MQHTCKRERQMSDGSLRNMAEYLETYVAVKVVRRAWPFMGLMANEPPAGALFTLKMTCHAKTTGLRGTKGYFTLACLPEYPKFFRRPAKTIASSFSPVDRPRNLPRTPILCRCSLPPASLH
jgi:hypothetical protein